MKSDSIKEIRSYLKGNILSEETFSRFNNEHEEIYNLLKRTIENGESNSALLIGPRGVGKTVVNYCFSLRASSLCGIIIYSWLTMS